MRNSLGFGAAGIAVILLVALFAPRLYVYLAADILIWGLCAVSLNLLIGYTGLVSFGHAAYFGIGAYVCGLLMKQAGLGFAAGMAIGTLAAALAAVAVGVFCVRLNAVYFSMLTLAFGQLFWAVVFRWNEVTGGDQGVTGLPQPDFSWLKMIPGLGGLDQQQSFLVVVGSVVVIVLILLHRLVQSPFGEALAMIRQNAQRAEFLAVPVRPI